MVPWVSKMVPWMRALVPTDAKDGPLDHASREGCLAHFSAAFRASEFSQTGPGLDR
jgi:hypothetical protein